MHIVLYHDAIIPPPRYGGTERVIAVLGRALISLGHRVTLIARPGSHLNGATLISVRESANWESLVPSDADILHLWSTPGTLPKIPFLVTIEGNGQLGEVFHPHTVFVSRKHAELHGSTHFVYNGIDPEDYPCDETRENYLVFLAKANWKVKNLRGALEVARLCGMPLKVMGNRNWPLRLNRLLAWPSRKVQYLGMVDDTEKRKILRKAKALIFPVRWHEPFGIAITEALASGCAVFGTPYGSLPEIVTPKTGALAIQANELAYAILRHTYSPAECRNRVSEGFTHLQMAENYLRYYRMILERGTLEPAPTKLTWNNQNHCQSLLPWV